MKIFNKINFLACGLLLTLAAFPVFAQEKSADEFKINLRPMQDLTQLVLEQVKTRRVDLTKPFLIDLEGVLTKDGRLDLKTTKFVKSEGDERMVAIGKSFIEAINYSGWFKYLKNLGVQKINFTLAQDDSQTYAIIISEQSTVERAKSFSSGLNLMVQMISIMDKDGRKKLDDDARILINGITVGNEGKNITLKFVYEKSIIQELISRKLREAEAKQSSE